MLITLNLGCQRSAEAPWAPLPVPVTREPAGGSATAPPERPQKRPPPPSEAPWLPPPLAALDPIDSSEGENDPAAPPAPVVGLSLDVFAPFATSVSVAGTFNAWTPGVALLEPTSDGRWVGLVAEARVGDRYKLVIETPSGQLWRNDPAARAVTNSVGESMVVDPHFDWSVTDFEPVPWNSTVIYEMHIGTFVDEPEGGPGTFDSAIEKLDDLAALGVTHLQLMPVAEFAGDFSWGYNPAHPFAVESSYGGLDGMRRFVDAAHARGLAVIVDLVLVL
ncbi:MAG: alpha-amylase family glycosyl hydrolase, partial [Myxococcota bacterium]